MQRKETVREFIDKRSYGAFVTFEFDLTRTSKDGFKQYRCVSVEDFLTDYGRKSSYILDDYVVVSTQESCFSQSQGQTIWMTLQKKSEYVKTLKSIELTPFEVDDFIKRVEKVKNSLDKEYYSDAIDDLEYVILRLENK